MESSKDEESDYFNSVIDNLVSMFGHIITKEVIATLVESYDGDLNQCVDAITEITSDGNVIPVEDNQPSTSRDPGPSTMIQQRQPSISYASTMIQQRQPSISYASTMIQQRQPSISYASSPQSTGTAPRQTPRTMTSTQYFWTDQIREIITHHNKGTRLMIILRGVPGSGKTHLARLLVDTLIGSSFASHKSHIFCSDDYFMVRGQYHYEKSYISHAHAWNQNKVRQAAVQGLSPIIVDNTNIETWEMRPYVTEAVNNGYIIEVVEPMTPWAKKARQLFNMNTHNVPLHKIKMMLDKYEENVTGDSLIRSFGLTYPLNMVPPIKRLVPAVSAGSTNMPSLNVGNTTVSSQIKITTENCIQLKPTQSNQNPVESQNIIGAADELSSLVTQTDVNASTTNPVHDTTDQSQFKAVNEMSDLNDLTEEEQEKQKIVFEAQKKIDELQKFEEDWENGEKWDESDGAVITNVVEPNNPSVINTSVDTTFTTITDNTSIKNIAATGSFASGLESKLSRKKPTEICHIETTNKDLMQSVTDCPDWRHISLFMPPWNPDEQEKLNPVQHISIEKRNSSTCVEKHDSEISGNNKVITATSRDINELYIPPQREKIPERRMLDKSTMTNDGVTMTFQCPQKERHFILFRNLFKDIERESLRYIFDNCGGDANWAVETIVCGGIDYKLKNDEDFEDSDYEEPPNLESDSPCTCMAKYEIVPDVSKSDTSQLVTSDEVSEPTTEDSQKQFEKKKRVVPNVSEGTMQLKREIEQNVVISDSHYSEHCLKIRKMRRGEYNKVKSIDEQPSTSGTPDTTSVLDFNNLSAANIEESSDEEDSFISSNINESDKIVNINLGKCFVQQIDDMFGRSDFEYPDNINYNISIPTSLLNEINALWIESMMFQLEENSKKAAAMIKQDEQFARQLELKEKELMVQGREPHIPDLREIMDLECALSIHLKDLSKWRKSLPKDLAAKMTQDKLCNLFPDISRDTLMELLVACENNFGTTVESLLISLGREDVLQAENGLNKFIMEKELQRQEKLLAEKKKAVSEAEPAHVKKGLKVDMATVEYYRESATQHMIRRDKNRKKAEDYVHRGMIPVAHYFSDVANFHTSQFEHANSMAVATLMQYHANNNKSGETVDLHFLRVKEAREAMDIFIDGHIQRLRETNRRSCIVFFITGRGLHSSGRPKIKPACMRRLQERGLRYAESNPGLLRSRIAYNSKMTYQIP